MDTLPPYTIPEADSDLWDCGVPPSEMEERRLRAGCRRCRDCGKEFYPEMPTYVRCLLCRKNGYRKPTYWSRVKAASIEDCVLTPEQSNRLQRYLTRILPPRVRFVSLDPVDGFRVPGHFVVGARKAKFRWNRRLDSEKMEQRCVALLRGAMVEET